MSASDKPTDPAAPPDQPGSPPERRPAPRPGRRLARRLGRLALHALGGTLALLILAFALLQTGPARRYLTEMISRAASGPERTVTVTGLSGLPPFDIRLDRLTLADRDGVWLAVENARLAWSPLALLRGRVQVRALTAGLVDLARTPRTEPTPDQPEPTPRGLPRLPSLALDELAVDRLALGQALVGQATVLTLSGGVRPAATAAGTEEGLYAELQAATLAPAPPAQVSLKGYVRQGEDWSRLSFQVAAQDAPDGLTAALTGLPFSSPVRLSLGGEGDFAAWGGVLDLDAGGLGGASADIRLRLDGRPAADPKDGQPVPAPKVDPPIADQDADQPPASPEGDQPPPGPSSGQPAAAANAGQSAGRWPDPQPAAGPGNAQPLAALKDEPSPAAPNEDRSGAGASDRTIKASLAAAGTIRLTPVLLPTALRQGDLPRRLETSPFTLRLALDESGAIRLDGLALATGLADLSARGRYAPDTERVQAAFDLRQADLAPLSPLAGTPLAGALRASGTVQGHVRTPEAALAIRLDRAAAAGWRAAEAEARLEAALDGDSPPRADQPEARSPAAALGPDASTASPPAPDAAPPPPPARSGEDAGRRRLALRGRLTTKALTAPGLGPLPDPSPSLTVDGVLRFGGARPLAISLTGLELTARETVLTLRGGLSAAEGFPADLAASLRIDALAPWAALVGQAPEAGQAPAQGDRRDKTPEPRPGRPAETRGRTEPKLPAQADASRTSAPRANGVRTDGPPAPPARTNGAPTDARPGQQPFQVLDGSLRADLSVQGDLAKGGLRAELTALARPERAGWPPLLAETLGQEIRLRTEARLAGYDQPELLLRDLRLEAARAFVNADGALRLADQRFTLAFKAGLDRLSALLPEAAPLPGGQDAVSLTGRAEGALDAFALRASLEGGGLAWQGAEIRRLRLDADLRELPARPQGAVTASLAANQGIGLEAKSDFALDYPALRLSAVNLTSGRNALTAQGSVDLRTSLADGDFQARLDDLSSLGQALGRTLAGALTAQGRLTAKSGRQDLTLELSGRELASTALTADALDASADLTDVRGAPGGRARLTARGAALSPAVRFESLAADATGAAGRLDVQLTGRGQVQEPLDFTAKGVVELGEGAPAGQPRTERPDRPDAAKRRSPKGTEASRPDQGGRTGPPRAGADPGARARTVRASALSGSYAGHPFALTQPLVLTLAADGLTLDRAVLRFAGGEIAAQVAVDSHSAQGRASVARLPLRALDWLGLPPLTGQANGALTLTGPASAPRLDFEATAGPLRLDDPAYAALPAASIRLQGGLADGRLDLRAEATGYGDEPLIAEARLPARLSLAPFAFALDDQAPLSGGARGRISLGRLAGALPLEGQRVTGRLVVDLTLSGALARPEAAGQLSLTEGRYENAAAGTILTNIEAQASFLGDRLELTSLTASDGGQGRLTGQGRLALAPDRRFPYALRAELIDAHLLRRRDVDGTVAGTASLEGDLGQALLTGTFTVGPAEINLPEGGGQSAASLAGLNVVELNRRADRPPVVKPAAPGPGSGAPEGFVVRLNLVARLPGRIFVRGRGLDSEWAGDLQVTGTAAAPLVSGALKVERGHFDFLDRRLEITKGTIAFQGANPPRPVLDISAEAETSDITAVVNVTGAIDSLKITFSSTPALPQDEVLSRLLFGRGLGSISPLQAISLARALAALSGRAPGGGPLDIVGNTRRFLGLEELEIRQSDTTGGNGALGGAALGVGKHLGENIYIRAQRGVDPQSGKVVLEIEITPNLSLESDVGETGAGGVGLNYKFDY